MGTISVKSISKLSDIHPDLRKLVLRAAEIYPYGELLVIEGRRTLAKQKEYFAAGKSKTMKSRHLTGHAVDLAPILDTDGDGDKELSWNAKHFHPINKAMQQASNELKIPIEWGGLWKTFVDCPHFQLPWAKYP